jgi:phage I-like protein
MLMGLKAQAAESEGLKKLLADAKVEREAVEANAMISEACSDGRIKGPAKRAEIEALLKDHGVKALKGFLSIMKAPAAQAVEPTAQTTAPAPGVISVVGSSFGLSKAELHTCKMIGVEPKDYAAQRVRYAAGFQEMNTKEEE